MLFTRRDLIKIIIPLLIEQILAVTIGMLDTMMVSTAGEAAVSGVSLVDTLNLLLIFLFSALAGGGAVVISQQLGKGDYQKAGFAAKQLYWTVLFISLLVMLFSLVFRKPLLSLIFGSIEPIVMKNAMVYFLFTALSYPFLGIYNSGAAIFRAMGNTKVSMIASVIMNFVNVAGNALLIFVFHMGAAGAAIATLFSRVVGAVIVTVLVQQKDNMIFIEKIMHYKPDFTIIKNICAIGIPNGLENAMFQLGKVLTQSLVSTFGTAQIAANAVANAISALQSTPGMAIGLAMITVVGRCVGAKQKKEAKQYTLKLLGVSYIVVILVSVVLCLCKKPLIGLYSLSPAASSIANTLFIGHTIFVCTIWPFSFVLPNAFRAASDVKYPMILSSISMWGLRIGCSYIFGSYLHLGVLGVWLAMFLDWIFRGVLFGIRYFRGTWLTKYKA